MSQLGFGVMINMLSGNESTVNAVKASLNKTIERVWLDEENNKLIFLFDDKTKLIMWDDGQSCCESRYMRTDDDLKEFSGSKLLDFELKNGPEVNGEYSECHEIQFLDVKTDKGIFQMANHNEHNGYYGGFSISAEMVFSMPKE
jgi:hypothetical protein